jgi:hypothetical protein
LGFDLESFVALIVMFFSRVLRVIQDKFRLMLNYLKIDLGLFKLESTYKL